MSRQYYGTYSEQNWGILAFLVGAVFVVWFCWYAEHRYEKANLYEAQEQLAYARQSGDWNDIQKYKAEVEEAQRRIDDGTEARAHQDYVKFKGTGPKNGSHVGDGLVLVLLALAGAGLLRFGWLAGRGVASALEGVLAVVCGFVVLTFVWTLGPLMAFCYFLGGMILMLVCSSLGNQCINRARWAKDVYDDDLGVNERRVARRRAVRTGRRPDRDVPGVDYQYEHDWRT